MSTQSQVDRGSSAGVLAGIARKGWRDIFLRVLHRVRCDNIALVSAGIAFNAMLAVFPALVVLLSVYGLFSSPAGVAAEMRPFFGMLPHDAALLIRDQLQSIASHPRTSLSIDAIVSIAVTIWSSMQGMVALTSAMNIAYAQVERRGYLELTGIALLFTLGAMAGLLLLLTLGLALPFLLDWIPIGFMAKAVALALRWVLLWCFAAGSAVLVYRFAPCRQHPRWRWVTWGSVSAATLWLAVGALFTAYVHHFGSYGKTYGALAGVMVLLMWFYLASFAFVLGAVLDAEIERSAIAGHPQTENQRSASPSSGH